MSLSLLRFLCCLMLTVIVNPLHALTFTAQQKEWIERNDEINVALLNNHYPYSYLNEEGKIDGLVVNYLTLLSEHTGITFNFDSSMNLKEAKNALMTGDVGLLPFYTSDVLAQSDTLSLPYFPYDFVLFSHSEMQETLKNEHLLNKGIGIVAGSEAESWVNSKFHDIKFSAYENQRLALTDLDKGVISAVFSEKISSYYLIESMELKNVVLNQYLPSWRFSMMQFQVNDKNTELIPILNKAIQDIPFMAQSEALALPVDSIQHRATASGLFGYGLQPYMYGHNVTVGFEHELAQEAFSLMGFGMDDNIKQALPEVRNNAFSVNEAKSGQQELLFSGTIIAENLPNMALSDGLFDLNYVLVSLSRNTFPNIVIQNTKKNRIGAVVQGSNSPSYLALEWLQNQGYDNSGSTFQNIEDGLVSLQTEEIDYLFVNRKSMLWHQQHVQEEFSAPLTYHEKPIYQLPIKMGFKNKLMRDRFNQALNALKAEPSYQNIVDYYSERNFKKQMQRATLLAEISAYFIQQNEISNLREVLTLFDVSDDIDSIEVFSTTMNDTLAFMQLNQSMALTKPEREISSILLRANAHFNTNPGANKVGRIEIEIDRDMMQSDHVYIPSLSQYQFLSDKAQRYIKNIYEAANLQGQNLNLTPEESVWIQNNRVHTVGIDPNALPYEAVDTNKDLYVGMIADFLKLLSSKTGLKFTPVLTNTWEETVQLIDEESVPIVSAATDNNRLKLGYRAGPQFFSSQLAIASKSNFNDNINLSDLNGKKIGILSGATNTAQLQVEYPNIQWQLVPNTTEGLKMLNRGELSGMIDTVHVLHYLLKLLSYPDINVVSTLLINVTPTLHILKTEPELYSIVNKAINAISFEERDAILSKWSQAKLTPEADHRLVYTVLSSASLIIIIMLTFLKKLSLQVKKTKQAQLHLSKSREQLFEVLNTSPIAICIWQGDRAVFVNQLAEELFKITQFDLESFATARIYVDVEERKKLEIELQEENRVLDRELQFYTGEGGIITALASYYIINHEEQPAILFWAYDISDLKHLNESLKDAVEIADNANNAKSNFLANMSHEIRTPMNAVIGMTHLALQGDIPEKEHSYLKKAYGAAKSLLQIINDILDFSKIEAGKLNIDAHEFNLSALLDSIQHMLEITAHKKNLSITFDVDNSLTGYFYGDSLRLKQVLINLISNAIKFTEEGNISVVVSSEMERESNEFTLLKFEVKDDGIGLTETQMENLFTSFSQADASTTRKYGGTGLGLSICKQLIELMGGKIGVTSEFGKGSTFYFSCPLKALDNVADAHYSPSANDLHILANKHILLVEDNELNQELACALLEQKKINVTVAENGLIACEKMQDDPIFDLILMDIQMPVMGGFEATEWIRSRYPDIPILAMTANVFAADKERIFAVKMNGIINKPIDVDEMFSEIESALNIAHHNVPLSSVAPQQVELQRLALNTKSGIAICNGDQTLYIRLLKRFSEGQDDFEVLFKRFCEQQQWQDATRLVHSLKGAAGNVGAQLLFDEANEVELICDRSNGDDAPPLIETLMQKMAVTMEAIQSYLAEQALDVEETNSCPLVLKITPEQLATLQKMINDFDTDVLALASKISEEVNEPLQLKMLSLFIDQLENFDFEGASETLQSLKEE